MTIDTIMNKNCDMKLNIIYNEIFVNGDEKSYLFNTIHVHNIYL